MKQKYIELFGNIWLGVTMTIMPNKDIEREKTSMKEGLPKQITL